MTAKEDNEVDSAPPAKRARRRRRAAETPATQTRRGYLRPPSGREMVSFYRALSIMMNSGIALFACFEFLSREGESKELCLVCRRISQCLVEGHPLHQALAQEPTFFDAKTVRLMEVGYQSGSLATIMNRLAIDQENAWKLNSQLKSELIYPLAIAGIATLAVLLLPPLVLTPILQQVTLLTSEPPAITKLILNLSSALSSPWTLSLGVLAIIAFTLASRTGRWVRWKDDLEIYFWEVPALGSLWRSIVAVRFLSVFVLTYESGLPATQCLTLSASATGSKLAHQRGEAMKQELVRGGTLRDSMEIGGFLPDIVMEAVEAGEQSGKVSTMLDRCAQIIQSEVQYRMEAVAKLVEPLVLTILGIFVGLFALGCLLPIIKLTETL